MTIPPQWIGYAWAIAVTLLATAVGSLLSPRFDVVNIAMVYLLGVVIVALRAPWRPALLTAVLGIVCFDFLFVPPVGAFTIYDLQYLLTFAIMLTVAMIISWLVAKGRRQSEEQARLRIEAETERIRGTLLASISHDLRTPLAVIIGESSNLIAKGESLSPNVRSEMARGILRHSTELAERVGKILQMTRLETGAMVLSRDWESIGEIVGVALERLRKRLMHHRVLVNLHPDLPLVRVDATLIEQALENLLENAARHTPSGTVVRVGAQLSKDKLIVSVEDYSTGAPDEKVQRVLVMFDGVAAGGSGLGLAICRAIVRLHGGETWAQRIPGDGLAFRFSLPVEAAPALRLQDRES